MDLRYTAADLQAYASDHEGRCLSKEYVDAETPLSWQCRKGHSWEAVFELVRQGGWCAQCAKSERKKEEHFQKIKAIAEKRGGKCLTDTYINSNIKLQFQCKEGHQFLMRPDPGLLNRAEWCAICQTENVRRKQLSDAKAFAEKKGGKFLSEEFTIRNVQHKWQCAVGHQFLMRPDIVYMGFWCITCKEAADRKKHFDSVKAVAQKKGGRCVTENYTHSHSKMEWECVNGHKWFTTPTEIKRGTWCVKCEQEKRFERSKNIAEKKGITCLSESNSPSNKMKWQCAKGHQWTLSAFRIRNKKENICNQCRLEEQNEKTFTAIKALAEKNGGKCLSEKYINGRQKIKWECAEGHQWLLRYDSVIAGQWCTKCLRLDKRVKQLEKLDFFAKKHGGKFLSAKYLGEKIQLQWQCSKGHFFPETPEMIKRGYWCTICKPRVKGPKKKKYTIAQLQEYAAKHGGKILSPEFIDTRTPLKWQCSKGHIWNRNAQMVTLKRWFCPECNGRKPK